MFSIASLLSTISACLICAVALPIAGARLALPRNRVAYPSGSTQGNGTTAKIGAIRVTGQKLHTAEQVIAATGLKSGQVFDAQQLHAIAEKLGKSGVFSDITYTYVSQGGLMAIDFKVEEAKVRACHFDNFVWLSDQEIDTRLKKDLPLYNGMAPETGEMLDEIPGVLETLSKEKGVVVRVSRRVEQDSISDTNWRHMYVAEGVTAVVQSVRFTGDITVNPDELRKQVAGLTGKEYSRFQATLYGNTKLVPYYRDRGYLRIAVAAQTPRVLGHVEGPNGYAVEIEYEIREGGMYRWDSVEWTGNASLATQKLEVALGMAPNAIANGTKIDEGWAAVQKEYFKSGYIDATVAPEALYDERAYRVRYRVVVAERSQYHMGKFAVTGAPPKISDRLVERWKLKTGDAYDGRYPTEYVNKEAMPVLRGALTRPPRVGITVVPNREQNTVDVTLKLE